MEEGSSARSGRSDRHRQRALMLGCWALAGCGQNLALGRRSVWTARSWGAGTVRGAPSSAGLGRAGAAAGAGLAGCLPGLVCQQGGGWQL